MISLKKKKKKNFTWHAINYIYKVHKLHPGQWHVWHHLYCSGALSSGSTCLTFVHVKYVRTCWYFSHSDMNICFIWGFTLVVCFGVMCISCLHFIYTLHYCLSWTLKKILWILYSLLSKRDLFSILDTSLSRSEMFCILYSLFPQWELFGILNTSLSRSEMFCIL